ncbi:unnamed protein product [Darwinula stevensoni]|uniref:Uncharacterized protein n=1 Tax=Darwinula stevensoni TaxID=69355 RepID=A0A7R8XB35_9CRUS|nr:unnamed protein product [Darwinula stevensoni]CAG0891201.1 unnamed protein product [Darwinula stevensoni]
MGIPSVFLASQPVSRQSLGALGRLLSPRLSLFAGLQFILAASVSISRANRLKISYFELSLGVFERLARSSSRRFPGTCSVFPAPDEPPEWERDSREGQTVRNESRCIPLSNVPVHARSSIFPLLRRPWVDASSRSTRAASGTDPAGPREGDEKSGLRYPGHVILFRHCRSTVCPTLPSGGEGVTSILREGVLRPPPRP